MAAGGLVAGMQVLGTISGATFRLVSDQASGAIMARAEAAAERAEAAAAGVDSPVSYAPQTLTQAQQAQARENIGAISHEPQALTPEQKAQLRENIAAVSYDQQTLTTAQQAQARENIGAAAVSGEAIVTLDDLDGQVAYWAHRGDMSRYPEHTMEAYRESVRNGSINLELDVWVTTDGVPFIMHDATIDRTTTGVGSTSAQNIVGLGALSVDAGVWLRGGWQNNYKVPLLEDVIAEFGNRVILHIECKAANTGPSIVALLKKYSIAKNMVVVTAFSDLSEELSWAMADGYHSLIGFSTWSGSPSAASLAASGYYGVFVNSRNTSVANMDILRAAGLKVYAYTVNRRDDAKDLVGHVDGIYTDDSEYLSGRSAPLTEDPFGCGRWPAGLLSQNNMDRTDDFRGTFFPGGYWGFSVQPTTHADYVRNRQVMQGWACPIGGDPAADEYEIEFSVVIAESYSDSSWAGISINAAGNLDRETIDSASFSKPHEKFYTFFKRRNGELCIYSRVGSTATQIATAMGATVPLNVEKHYRVVVTPSRLSLHSLNGPGGSPIETATVNDASYRGGYFNLGVNGAAARWRRVRIFPG